MFYLEKEQPQFPEDRIIEIREVHPIEYGRHLQEELIKTHSYHDRMEAPRTVANLRELFEEFQGNEEIVEVAGRAAAYGSFSQASETDGALVSHDNRMLYNVSAKGTFGGIVYFRTFLSAGLGIELIPPLEVNSTQGEDFSFESTACFALHAIEVIKPSQYS